MMDKEWTRTSDDTLERPYVPKQHEPLEITIQSKDKPLIRRVLAPYGETKIVTHGGKVTFIETSVKEKVE